MTDPVQDARLAAVAVHIQAALISVRLTLLAVTVVLLVLGALAVTAEWFTGADLGAVPIILTALALGVGALVIPRVEAPFTRAVLARLERDPR